MAFPPVFHQDDSMISGIFSFVKFDVINDYKCGIIRYIICAEENND